MAGGLGREELVEALTELALHKLRQPIDIVLYAEEVVVSIALGEGLGVGEGIEDAIQLAIALAGAEEAGLLVPEVAVGAGTLAVDLLHFVVTHPGGIACDSIIVVGILEGLRDALVLAVARHVALLAVVVQPAVALALSRRAEEAEELCFVLGDVDPAQDGLDDDGYGVVADHHIGLGGEHIPHGEVAFILLTEVDE